MRALVPALVLFAAGCAWITSADLRPLPTPEVCYIGMVRPDYRQLAFEEVARRQTSCEHYTAEIRAVDQAMRQRAAEQNAAGTRLADFGASPASPGPESRTWKRAR